MTWLRKLRTITRNDYEIETAARKGSFEDFKKMYVSPYDANIFVLGHSLLSSALTNNNVDARIAIANMLLDDGIDLSLGDPLTAFLSYHAHDFKREVPLLRRLLDGDININKSVGKWGTPLITLATNFKFKESDLEPFYDVFFARPDLDFSATVWRSKGRDSVYLQIQRIVELRPNLLKRTDAYLQKYGQARPDDARNNP